MAAFLLFTATGCPSRKPSPSTKQEPHRSKEQKPPPSREKQESRQKAAAAREDKGPKSPREKVMDQVEALLVRGDQERGRDLLHNFVEKNPQDLVAAEALARLLISQRRIDAALKLATKAMKISPDRASLHGIMARAYFLGHRHEKALVCLTQAEKLEPRSPLWPRLKGESLLALKKTRAALKALKVSLALDDKSSWTLVLMGDALWALDRANEAQAAYRKAADLATDGRAFRAEALDRLATLLRSKGKIDAAKKVIDECTKLFPILGCPYGEASLMPPDPTQPHRKETFVKPPSRRY